MEKYSIKVHKEFVKELFDTNNMYNIKQFNVDDYNNIQSIDLIDESDQILSINVQQPLDPMSFKQRVCSLVNPSIDPLVFAKFCNDNSETYIREDYYDTDVCDEIIKSTSYDEDPLTYYNLLLLSNCVIDDRKPKKKSNMMLIIGAGVGGVVLIGIIIFLIIYLRRR